jgi:nucleotide-binding universal stress UspA family protein
MINIKKILLPVDFPVASLSMLHQAATLARRFHSEIVLLHVVTQRSHAAGVPEEARGQADWDLLAAIIRQAQIQHDPALGPELEALTIRCLLGKGDTAAAIMRTAEEERPDLIMMPSHSFTFYQFLLGSVTAKVLYETECPVWTGAHVEESAGRELAIRSVLCAVEFGPRAELTMSWAAQMATEFGARLTLANVTSGVEIWGPGGMHIDQRMKEELVSNASEQMAKLQQDMGIKADVFIGSGDVPKVLTQAAKQMNADLLVINCYPYGGNLRTHGFAIICAVQIPVLSV